MGAVRNMVRGFIYATIYLIFTIVIPILTFTWIQNLEVQGIAIQLEQQNYQNIIFWVTALGLIICSCAFFNYSSPKHSIRRGIFALIQVLVNSLYVWSYKFSGATSINFVIINMGYFSLDLQQMILIYLGVYFFSIILKMYDILDFIINRKQLRENRMKAL
jgi:hypothetical protein